MNSLAPIHLLWISVCTEKNMKKKKLNTEWTLSQNMYYTEKVFREEQYTPWKYSLHGMTFGNVLQPWWIQSEWLARPNRRDKAWITRCTWFKKYFMKDKSIQQRKYYKETEVKCTIKSILVTNWREEQIAPRLIVMKTVLLKEAKSVFLQLHLKVRIKI